MASEQESFDIQPDGFKCISVKTAKLPKMSPAEFEAKLSASIEKWTNSGIRGLWVKLEIEDANLVPVCTKLGLTFHHAQSSYVMLKAWLHPTETNTLPDYATQYLGAGGFVVNDKEEVLVVKERFHSKPHWKLPGGHANPGEDIGEAAAREVLEETGIAARFESIICFRHQHQYRYGCSDFYFICRMRAVTTDIKPCQSEIMEAKWMKVREYAHHPDVSDANRHFAQCYLSQSSQNLAIITQPVLAYTKDKYHNCYIPQIQEETKNNPQ